MECIYVTFTSYISSGRCTVMENLIPPCLPRGFVCGQVVMIRNSTLNTRGHKAAKNSIHATSLILFSWGLASDEEKREVISTWSSSVWVSNMPAEVPHLQPRPSFLPHTQWMLRQLPLRAPEADARGQHVHDFQADVLGSPPKGAQVHRKSPVSQEMDIHTTYSFHWSQHNSEPVPTITEQRSGLCLKSEYIPF